MYQNLQNIIIIWNIKFKLYVVIKKLKKLKNFKIKNIYYKTLRQVQEIGIPIHNYLFIIDADSNIIISFEFLSKTLIIYLHYITLKYVKS